MSPDRVSAPVPAATRTRPALGRLAPAAAILIVAIVVVAMGWHRQLSLETLVRHRAALMGLV